METNSEVNDLIKNEEKKEKEEKIVEIIKVEKEQEPQQEEQNGNNNNNKNNNEENTEKDIKENNNDTKSNNINQNNKITITKETEEENINLKPQKEKSEFEIHIVQAYKILTGINSSNSNNSQENENISENKKEKDIISNSENILNIKNCEKEIRLALNTCINSKIISLNKNILDKMSRIIKHNKINLIFIIGQIYINLMSKDYLFNPLNKNINKSLLIFFCNEVITLNALLKETYLGNKFNTVLINFIIRIMSEYTLEKEQILVMREILERHNINQKPIKIKANNFEEMTKFINETLNEQESFYEQYKFIFDNGDYIGSVINSIDINNQAQLKYLNYFLD